MNDELYLLISNNDKLVAMSEDMELMKQYVFQMNHYMPGYDPVYQVVKIIEESKIKQLLFIYGTSASIQPYTDNIVLTELEIKYYDPLFKSMYQDIKLTIKNLVLSSEIMQLTLDNKKSILDSVDVYCGKIHSYQSYLETLDVEKIFKYYITEPLLCVNIVETEVECLKNRALEKVFIDRNMEESICRKVNI